MTPLVARAYQQLPGMAPNCERCGRACSISVRVPDLLRLLAACGKLGTARFMVKVSSLWQSSNSTCTATVHVYGRTICACDAECSWCIQTATNISCTSPHSSHVAGAHSTSAKGSFAWLPHCLPCTVHRMLTEHFELTMHGRKTSSQLFQQLLRCMSAFTQFQNSNLWPQAAEIRSIAWRQRNCKSQGLSSRPRLRVCISGGTRVFASRRCESSVCGPDLSSPSLKSASWACRASARTRGKKKHVRPCAKKRQRSGCNVSLCACKAEEAQRLLVRAAWASDFRGFHRNPGLDPSSPGPAPLPSPVLASCAAR